MKKIIKLRQVQSFHGLILRIIETICGLTIRRVTELCNALTETIPDTWRELDITIGFVWTVALDNLSETLRWNAARTTNLQKRESLSKNVFVFSVHRTQTL